MVQEKWLVDGPKVIDLEAVRSLKVGLLGGQVDIVGHDEPGARVEVHAVSGRELKVSVDDGRLEVDHPQLRWDNFIDVFRSFRDNARADVSIMVPRDVALTLGVVTASGLVTGLTADATMSTVNGDLVVDGLSGNVQLHSVNGEVSVRNHDGALAVHTVSGDVTAAGEIRSFTCDSVSGDVYLDIAGTPDVVRVKSVSGNVTMRLEPGTPAYYRIATVSGRIQLDDGTVSSVRGSYTGRSGPLEKAFLEFRANTVSGDVSVLHTVHA